MTNFADMRNLVVSFTKRPELVALTDQAIRMATLRAHHVDMFPRDRAFAVFTYTPPVSGLFVDITNLYTEAPLFRIADFMQSEDVSTSSPTENLEYVDTYKEFWDNDNVLRSSVFTHIGDTLRVRFAAPTGRAALYYFKNPNTQVGTYASWIADLYPEEVAMWAAAIVWARTGNVEQARITQEMHLLPFKDLLVSSHLVGKI